MAAIVCNFFRGPFFFVSMTFGQKTIIIFEKKGRFWNDFSKVLSGESISWENGKDLKLYEDTPLWTNDGGI